MHQRKWDIQKRPQVKMLLCYTLKKMILHFFKVSGCKQIILAIFTKKLKKLKVSQLNLFI